MSELPSGLALWITKREQDPYNLSDPRELRCWQTLDFPHSGRSARCLARKIAKSDLAGILVHEVTERERRQLGAEYGVVPGKRFRGFTEDGITRLLSARLGDRHATRQIILFKHWLQTDAFPNVRRLPGSSA